MEGGARSKVGGRPESSVVHYSIVTWEKDHVRAAVVELTEGSAELMGVAAAPIHGIGRTSHPDLDRWVAGCDKALTQAEDMTAALSGRKLVPDYAIMSVPTEVTHSLPVATSRRRRDASVACTLDELRALLQRGYRQAQDVVGAHARDANEDIIHGSLTEVCLDGQAVESPLGLHGEQFDARMSFSLAPLEWIRALEIVAERLELRLTAIVPQNVTFASPLPDTSALLILLDEEHTSLNLVRNGHLRWASLVEIGERDMIGTTAEALGLRGRQADALMRAYRARQLREDAEIRVARVFWGELRRWMTALAESIKGAAEGPSIPSRIYFADMTRRIPEALQSLTTPFWEQSLSPDRCPEVIEFGVSTVRDVLDRTTQATGPAFLPLRALAHYVAELYIPQNDLDRALVETVHWRHTPSSRRLR